MIIQQEMVGSVAVLHLNGTLVLGQGDQMLKDKVRSLIFEGHKKIALDLGGVSYIDSAGLGELVSAHATVTRNEGKIRICNLTKRVSDLLTITKLLTVFDMSDSKDQAVK